MSSKRCPKCGITKDISAFAFRNISKGYRQTYCRSCKLEYQRGDKYRQHVYEYRRKPEIRLKASQRHFSRTFGISLEDVNVIISSQHNKCYLCKDEFDTSSYRNSKAPVIDHDHKLLKIRRALCQSCNKTLGFIEKARNDGLLTRMVLYSQGAF